MKQQTNISQYQADINELMQQISFWGEDDGYFSFISDCLLPSILAYISMERGTFGSVSNDEYLSRCQQLHHLLLDLKKFSDKYPDPDDITIQHPKRKAGK